MIGITIEVRRKLYPAVGEAPARHVYEDFSLEVAPGTCVGLLGSSGIGKTTLLNMVAGLDREYEGRIAFTGRDRGPRIAYAFQAPRLLPWRTALENVVLPLPPGARSQQRALQLLGEMGLGQARDAYPARLSLGEQRRVALARALAIEPDLLLMDEPFVSLDETTAGQLRALLTDVLHKHPTTVLFVTHDVQDAFRLADQLVFLGGVPASIAQNIPNPLPKAERGSDATADVARAQCRSLEPP
jgi:ABC-type nitrate/sulfonate/bicarbonate transport system ATPase subunit